MSNIKDAKGKPDLSLLPSTFLKQVANVRAFGDTKYGPLWSAHGRSARQMVAAMVRHCYEYLDGVDRDGESGEHPLAHVAAGVAVVLYELDKGVLVDDRAPATKDVDHNHKDADLKYNGDILLISSATRDMLYGWVNGDEGFAAIRLPKNNGLSYLNSTCVRIKAADGQWVICD